MSGETNLKTILNSLSPVLLEDRFVFCTFPRGSYGDFAETCPKAYIMENEGLTLVLDKAVADSHGFDYNGEFSCISLQVHSSLNSVGLTATLSGVLAAHQISVNMIAGYHHDHLFVPKASAGRALELLAEVQKSKLG
jgi:hypothetical protein